MRDATDSHDPPGSDGPARTSTSLRSEPAFVRWVVAEGVSMVGTAVSTIVLPLLVYDVTGSAAQTGLMFAFRAIPYLVLGLIAGPVADRGNRRALIIGGNLVEGVLVLTIPLASLFGLLSAPHIYAVALLSATAFVFSDAAVFGAVPALVGHERLAAANGLLSSMSSASNIAGPVIGGLLVALIGASGALSVTAAGFLIAAGVQTRIRSTFRPAGWEPPSGGTLRAHVGMALRFIRQDRVIATLLGVGFGNSFAMGAVVGLLVPYAVEVLGLPTGDGRLGLLYATLGVGSLAAGALFQWVFRPARVRLLTPATLLTSGGTAVGLSLVRSWPVAAVLLVVFSFGLVTTISTGITYRQLAAPDHLRSSVNVIGRMIAWGGQPFGAAMGAAVSTVADVAVVYAVAASVLAVSSLVAASLLWPISTELAADQP